jgi:hypothetical protein
MRRASRVDTNQPEIVDALRKAGCAVVHTHMLGKDVPDLMVAHEGNTWLEIKMPGEGLTPGQREWHAWWQSHGGQAGVAHTVDEAFEVCGVTRRVPHDA